MGGKATAQYGSRPLNKNMILTLCSFLEKELELKVHDLIVGSSTLVLNGKKAESGDLDILLVREQESLISKIEELCGAAPRITGGNVFSFPFRFGTEVVQVDFIVVTNLEWGKFAFHASENTNYNSSIRNELIHALVHNSRIPNVDLIVNDKNDNTLVKIAKSYKLAIGLQQSVKSVKFRKDGAGVTKNMSTVEPDEAAKMLEFLKVNKKYFIDTSVINNPLKFCQFLIRGSTEKDFDSFESLHACVKEKRKDSAAIFVTCKSLLEKREFQIPSELKQ